jgi:hypothetical protein
MELVGLIIVGILIFSALLIACIMLGGTWLGTKIFPEPETSQEPSLVPAVHEHTAEVPTPSS